MTENKHTLSPDQITYWVRVNRHDCSFHSHRCERREQQVREMGASDVMAKMQSML